MAAVGKNSCPGVIDEAAINWTNRDSEASIAASVQGERMRKKSDADACETRPTVLEPTPCHSSRSARRAF
jgi:hypothetical protein